MHTINGNEFTRFHFDGDFDGDVIIVRHGVHDAGEMRVSMDALDALFAERIRRKRIQRLENMTDAQVIADAIGL